ncbi:hypothetical protein EVAR_13145_1 [Eumeta japonica]|uniref:Uncharacterized protein n=1 Tax=Eumeta variegata TaxID=151549 RepID=A0A4C1UB32_EUMVA|nr:hypothetical protein EVAR_13145_1 [Eumeta japonica]
MSSADAGGSAPTPWTKQKGGKALDRHCLSAINYCTTARGAECGGNATICAAAGRHSPPPAFGPLRSVDIKVLIFAYYVIAGRLSGMMY